MNLFNKQNVILNSGLTSDFKIECDALTEADYDCIAQLIGRKLQFKRVVGVSNGGLKLEKALEKCCVQDDTYATLICGDVLTTGESMNRMKENLNDSNVIGVVIFARGKCPEWVMPIFTFWENDFSAAI